MLNKKMLLSLLVIGVVSVSAGAGTWAYFTDTETSEDNTFTAGTLDLLVNGINPGETNYAFDESDLYPGWEDTYAVTFTNDGSINAAELLMDITNTMNFENGFEDPEVDDGEGDDGVSGDPTYGVVGDLGENMNLKIEEYDSTGTTLIGTPYDLPLNNFVTLNLGALDAGETRYFLLTGSIDGVTVGNEIQGDSIVFDFEFALNQVVTP